MNSIKEISIFSTSIETIRNTTITGKSRINIDDIILIKSKINSKIYYNNEIISHKLKFKQSVNKFNADKNLKNIRIRNLSHFMKNPFN